jgi:hypothetical protein
VRSRFTGVDEDAGSADVLLAEGVGSTVEASSDLAFLLFFFLFCRFISMGGFELWSYAIGINVVGETYLLPAPQRLEAVEKANILEQVREEPKTRRDSEDSDAEQDQTEDRHGKEESQ